MTIHVGISGPIAAGKSTLARGLVDIFAVMSKKAAIIAFAAGLKYLATLYDEGIYKAYQYFIDLGYTHEESLAATYKLVEGFIKYPVLDGNKPRKLYQWIGTEVGRDTLDPDIWVKTVRREVEQGYLDILISDDLRFVNESKAVDIHVAITVPDNDPLYNARKLQYPDDYFFSDHPSETERDMLFKPDFTIPIGYKVSDAIMLARKILEPKKPAVIPSYTTHKVLMSGSIDPETDTIMQNIIRDNASSITAFDKDRFQPPYKPKDIDRFK